MRTILGIFGVILGALVGALLLIGLAFALAGETVTRELDKEQRPAAITARQFDRLDVDATREEVERRLGDSARAEEFEVEGLEQEEPEGSSCVYYDRRGGRLGDIFQICFRGDRVHSTREL